MDEIVQEEIAETVDAEEPKKEKFKWTKDRIFLAIIFTIVVLFTFVIYGLVIWDKTFLFDLIANYFLIPIYQLHVAYKVLIFFGFMILQAIVAPIPSEVILTTGGILFRWWGIPVGVVGSMISAVLAFYISKRGGRSIVDATGEKIKFLDRAIVIFDEWIKRWGIWAILLGRALPFVAFDNISYAAGLAKIKDWYYHLATFIGCFPRTAFYSFIGIGILGEKTIEDLIADPSLIETAASRFNAIFFSLFGIFVFMFILSNVIYYLREKKKKKEKALTSDEETEEEDFTEKIEKKLDNSQQAPISSD
jgi:uncharacterized membrane protein YdjX (TVP38/TMEM64 family)